MEIIYEMVFNIALQLDDFSRLIIFSFQGENPIYKSAVTTVVGSEEQEMSTACVPAALKAKQ